MKYQDLWLEAIKNGSKWSSFTREVWGRFLRFHICFHGCATLSKSLSPSSPMRSPSHYQTVWNIAELPNHPIYWLSVEPASLGHGETWSQSQRWFGYHWYIFHTSGQLQMSKAVRASLGFVCIGLIQNFVGFHETPWQPGVVLGASKRQSSRWLMRRWFQSFPADSGWKQVWKNRAGSIWMYY